MKNGCYVDTYQTHQPSFLQYIHDILPLNIKNIIIGLCHLNTLKISKFTKIFGLKMVTKMLFQLRDTMVVTPYKNDVINIYYQVNTSNTRVLIKDKIICFTSSHTKLLNNIAKLSKPRSRRLFQAIQGFAKTTYHPRRLLLSKKPRRLLHINFFLQITNAESIFNIQLINRPLLKSNHDDK